MKSFIAKLFRLRALILGALILAGLLLSLQPLMAETDACALLKAGDMATLLGGTPTSKASPEGQACTWTGPVAGRKLLVLTYKNKGVPVEAAFMGAHKNAQEDKDVKVSDESGLGDQAFSGQASFGAFFIVLKQGRMMQIQYWTGGQGTSQDVAVLRPVVQKAVGAF